MEPMPKRDREGHRHLQMNGGDLQLGPNPLEDSVEVIFRKLVITAASGTLAWLLANFALRASPTAPALPLQLGLFGLFVAGAVAAGDSWYESETLPPDDVALATLVGGIISALVGAAVDAALRRTAATNATLAFLAFYGPWLLVGATVGLAASVRIGRMSRERLVNGLLGGLVGGVVGGAILFSAAPLSLGPSLREIVSATSWALVGGAVAAGVSLAPGMTGKARLIFRSSRAAGARSKLGRMGRIDLGTDTMCLGSRPLLADKAVVLLVPDPEVHHVHCFLVCRQGRYEVHYPEDNRPGSPNHRPVLMNDRQVPHQGRLRHGAVITIGGTSFDFRIRRGEAA